MIQVKYMRREEIIQNFEKMELLLIVDFHLFNLIFCKEDLMLNNRKTAVLMNILWQLLMNKNPGYIRASEGDVSARIIEQSQDPSQIEHKTLENDVALLKNLLLSHSRGKTEAEIGILSHKSSLVSMKFFSTQQVKSIVEYAFQSYLDKFNLYKYVFENKKKNEEVKLMISISEPARVPPLREALYMGSDLRPVFNEEMDRSPQQSIIGMGAADQSMDMVDGSGDQEFRSLSRNLSLNETGLRPTHSKVKKETEAEIDPDVELVDQRISSLQNEVEGIIMKNDELIHDKIASKGKKKK